MRRLLWIIVLCAGHGLASSVAAQCTNYTIAVSSGLFPFEVSWQLVAPGGGIAASGFAPTNQVVCLNTGCYTLYLYDSFGDGWNGSAFTMAVQSTGAVVYSGTLSTGTSGQAQVNIGGGCNPPGCVSYNLTVTAGSYPTEISWNLVGTTSIVSTGFAPSTTAFCVLPGCYTIQMFDDFGDGWNGATWTVTTAGGAVVSTGTLGTGSIGTSTFGLGVPAGGCVNQNPVVASDCAQAVNVCTNINFLIDPNGAGSVNEIPPLGSLGNPDLWEGDFINSTWGSDNWGCLRNNELNSTWMVVNIAVGGSLEFIFGGLGSQAGFYDWIMYPYTNTTCAQVSSNTIAPVRCNWNGVSFGGTGLAASVPPGGDPTNYEPPLNVVTGQRFLICFSNWSSVTTSVPLVFGGTAVVSCTPLPVELIAFDATLEQDAVALRWVTATELNSLRFEIERMTEAQDWRVIGDLEAAGFSNLPLDYTFLDADVQHGITYYRLHMIDTDGSSTYSLVRSVHNRANAVSCHPNPTTGTFTIQQVPDGVLPEVLDAMGRRMAVELTPGPAGAAFARMPDCAPGMYSIRVGEQAAMKLLVVAP